MTAEDVKFSFERQLRRTKGMLFAQNIDVIKKITVLDPYTIQFTLDVYWIVHNFVRVHFTTRQVPAVALGILDHGFALHELFLIQKAA